MNLKRLILVAAHSMMVLCLFGQSVGIGTTSPHAKAALEIKSTDKGVLFPLLTSAQRNAITNPPNGLHVFNTDEHCLNYFDSIYAVWNCYCTGDTCRVVNISITADACNVDFYNAYAKNFPAAKKYAIVIESGVTLSCGVSSPGAIDFNTLPYNATIKIINKGTIYGAGGGGGSGATGQVGGPCSRTAAGGSVGGNAITTKTGVPVSIENYGIIGGGGGGGGGGGRNVIGEFGGGGGGGAGTTPGTGGIGGGNTFSGPFGSCGTITSIAQNGITASNLTGGGGGTGASGGGNGGAGGGLGQSGQNGTGTAAGAGGAAGKAIAGGSGNSIINKSGGQSFGVVD